MSLPLAHRRKKFVLHSQFSRLIRLHLISTREVGMLEILGNHGTARKTDIWSDGTIMDLLCIAQ
jgi:hypothetical protein